MELFRHENVCEGNKGQGQWMVKEVKEDQTREWGGWSDGEARKINRGQIRGILADLLWILAPEAIQVENEGNLALEGSNRMVRRVQIHGLGQAKG